MIRRTLVLIVLLSTACTVGIAKRPQNPPSAEPTNPALVTQTSPLPTATLTAPPAPPVLTEAAPSPTAPPATQETFQPGQPIHAGPSPLYGPDLEAYLDALGIESLNVPDELGALLLNVDWDSAQMPGATGRMFSLGFENLLTAGGRGWGAGYIVYATYDFALGTEYDTFANLQDRDAVRNRTMPDMIEVDGVPGFVRVQPSAYSFGTRGVFKTYVFPFEDYYVAVVYTLGYFDFDADWEAILSRLQAGDYPEETRMYVPAIDALATSIQFLEQK